MIAFLHEACFPCIFSLAQLHSNQQQQAQLRVNKLQRVIKTVIVRLSFFVLIFIVCGAPSTYDGGSMFFALYFMPECIIHMYMYN